VAAVVAGVVVVDVLVPVELLVDDIVLLAPDNDLSKSNLTRSLPFKNSTPFSTMLTVHSIPPSTTV
jgi:hypothetical protein